MCLIDCNSFIYKENRLSHARLIKNIVKKRTCKWPCTIIFKLLWHLRTLSTSFKYEYISLKQSCKTPVKKDLMRIILFRTYEHLKLYIIPRISCVLIIFYIYQTIHFFLINSSTYPPNLRNVSSITVKIRQFQIFPLMHILIANVYMQP